MKISVNRLKDFIHFEESPEEIAALLTGSGLEVEGIEVFESIQGGLEGVVIGEVLTCERHPNADKLSLTTVDIGDQVVPIVCGAPNVAKGQKVVVAKEGCTLYPISGEPFEIKKAKIRGEVSQGMICAEDEIGIGESHAGIMVLDTDLPNGTPASAYFEVVSASVLEIGLTPNRADAASHLGVARDLKALLKRDICLPSVEDFNVDHQARPISVEVENPADCPRYAGLTISNVKVGPSPAWLQNYLKALDLDPINNIVDITNFILHDLGQPLHAFDADKISGGKIIVKKLPKDSHFVTLDEKQRKLSGEELMICDQEGGLCIAGIFGGKGSGVSDATTSIFLESACFSPDVIRRGSQFHGLKTDASFRFERGTDPNMPVYALKRAAMLIKEIAGGEISSEIVDLYPEPVQDRIIEVSYAHINRLIGKVLPKGQIKEILESLEINYVEESETHIMVSVKPYRVDVEREADVIEEILRIYGFDNVELSENLQSDYLAEHPAKDFNKLQYRLSELLSGMGYFEMITNSLTKPLYAEKSGFLDPSKNVEIYNKLSEDLGVMRQSLLFTGLEVLAHNINRRQKDLKFFEFGTVYAKEGDAYQEGRRLALFLTGDKAAESWLEPSRQVAFSDLYAVVELILEKLHIDQVEVEIVHVAPFDYALQLRLGTKELGKIGVVQERITKLAEVKQEVLFAELDWDLLMKKAKGLKKYGEISKFPEVRRDLSLVIDKTVTFDQIKKVALKAGGKLLQRIGVFDVYQGDKIDAGKKAYALSFYLQDTEQTLTDKVIDKAMDRLIQSFEKEVGAFIRK
ncbi:phenylalanine--tRNA ligase subunit beta [Cecembia lonarensis]|uniref:Phenylalanine--tRNA ligase beta subunit n=1 Tax=Cecembia lonarensis (strain CCUG 58316 / KCTC 22772 / LW9) TaxID=1225176 RepID=K1LC32_CECL9|nr:phenylalanine--tRNA ligase subunit beta [Cecembia lonarensis]EKB47928.1 Phenylalanine--tRNA ligase beta subunit [Cecembia lonarensis LW9]